MKVKSLITSTLVVFGLAASCTAVQADSIGNVFEPTTKVVDYSGFDLSSDKGAAMFYGRVKSASRTVCAQFDNKESSLTDNFQKCYDHALAAAVATVNQSKVTALYAATNKSRPATRLASLR